MLVTTNWLALQSWRLALAKTATLFVYPDQRQTLPRRSTRNNSPRRSFHGPIFGSGGTSRSYRNDVSPERRILRTVFRAMQIAGDLRDRATVGKKLPPGPRYRIHALHSPTADPMVEICPQASLNGLSVNGVAAVQPCEAEETPCLCRGRPSSTRMIRMFAKDPTAPIAPAELLPSSEGRARRQASARVVRTFPTKGCGFDQDRHFG